MAVIEKFLDPYELKARVAPGLIIAVPLLADALYAAPLLSSWPIFAASGVCAFALLYGMSLIVRAAGRSLETGLWASWGGPPSTRFMRHRDGTFGAELKAAIRIALAQGFSVHLLSAAEEGRNPEAADIAILDAFRQVRAYLRQHDPGGLWFKHDIEYGFCRNLLACRMAWALVSGGAALFAVLYAFSSGARIVNPASIIGCISFICALCVGWLILPDNAKRAGETYAESAWMAFLHIGAEHPSRLEPIRFGKKM
jgi:hypothetical protein